MNWLAIAKILLSLLPLIIQGIQSLESAMPGAGQGSAKLDALRGILQAAYTNGQQAEAAFETIWPAIAGAVGNLVSTFNKAGVFKSGA